MLRGFVDYSYFLTDKTSVLFAILNSKGFGMVFVLSLIGCFPSFSNLGSTFPENPKHDYDNDGQTEEQGDC